MKIPVTAFQFFQENQTSAYKNGTGYGVVKGQGVRGSTSTLAKNRNINRIVLFANLPDGYKGI
jgi:hypothetical protein